MVRQGRQRQAEVAQLAPLQEAMEAENRRLEAQLAELEGRMRRMGEAALERRGQEELLVRTKEELVRRPVPSVPVPRRCTWRPTRRTAGGRQRGWRGRGARCRLVLLTLLPLLALSTRPTLSSPRRSGGAWSRCAGRRPPPTRRGWRGRPGEAWTRSTGGRGGSCSGPGRRWRPSSTSSPPLAW